MTESTFSQRQQMLASLNMVEIPEGEFLYGSSDTDTMACTDEKPQKSIFLPAFRIVRAPVTNKQWSVFLQESGYKPTENEHIKRWDGVLYPSRLANHPAVHVSKHDADAFCSFYGLRLPSEFEWEKAARGTDGRLWPWGNQLPEWWLCNFRGFHKGTTPVGSFPQGASPYGLLDCAGNVREWTSSLSCSGCFSLRGGYFFTHNVSNVRCAARSIYSSHFCDDFVGFRPVRDT
jgi:formylglycine-generating enzyme required for sulfatase activity